MQFKHNCTSSLMQISKQNRVSGVRIFRRILSELHSPISSFLGSEVTSYNIHIVGAESEANMPKLFMELQYILPNIAISIHFYGPKISKSADNKSLTLGRVSLSFHRGLYHDRVHTRPHVVLGYNAGLAAYPSWKDTLLYVVQNSVPSYFTDYCQWSIACSDRCIKQANIGTLSAPEINPFRSPVSIPNESHHLPCYSNGFIYSLKPQAHVGDTCT